MYRDDKRMVACEKSIVADPQGDREWDRADRDRGNRGYFDDIDPGVA
jgi:hypothetical protein